VFGTGVLKSFNSDVSVKYIEPVTKEQRTLGPFPYTGTTVFTTTFGGVLRFYLGPHFGVRAEAKAYKPTGALTPSGPSAIFGKAEIGLFVQLE
jgi:hypothetical protein